jgi:hypothetical protein
LRRAPQLSVARPRQVTFLNSEARPEDRKLRVVPSDDGEGSSLFLSYTVKGVWHHRFDLRHFPLDTQTLVMRGVLWRSALERVVDVDPATGEVLQAQPYHGRVRFVPEPCQLYHESFTNSDVWCAYPRSRAHPRKPACDMRCDAACYKPACGTLLTAARTPLPRPPARRAGACPRRP